MMRILWSIVLFGMVIGLLACGPPPVYKVTFSYSSFDPPAKVTMRSSKKIKIKQFEDKSMQEYIGHHADSGGGNIYYYWAAQNDLGKVITDAVKIELANQGYQIVQDNEDLKLHGYLLYLYATLIPSTLSFKLKINARVRVELKDNKEDKIKWSDTVNEKFEKSHTILLNKYWEDAFNKTVKNLIEKIIRSEGLHEHLQ